MSEYAKKFIKKVGIIFCISFVGMFVLLCLFVNLRGRDSDYDADEELRPDTEEMAGPEKESSGEEEEADTPSEEELLAQDWGLRITTRSRMDFHRVLLEDDYSHFDGHAADSRLDEKFSFAYPTNLYHTVEAEASEEDGYYSVSFRGRDNGALLLYSQERQEESADPLEEMYEEDRDTLTEAETLLHLDTVYVLTGFEDDRTMEVYKVVKADEENLYTMVIKTPVPEKEDARTLLSFYTEYLYRSCGFSGSSKEPRSYVEFLRGDD